jgi:hypothetical protein
MDQILTKGELNRYYENYIYSSSVWTLLFMSLTAGIYIINWLYLTNKEFEKFDENAPDSNRGAALTLIIPVSWLVLAWIGDNLGLGNNELFRMVKTIGWLTIVMMILKYMYDFCTTFSRFTRSNELIWYYALFPGMIFYVLAPLVIWYDSLFVWFTYPFLFFTIVAVSSMQAKLNAEKNLFDIKEGEGEFYRKGRIM